jgi:hypothetical protein
MHGRTPEPPFGTAKYETVQKDKKRRRPIKGRIESFYHPCDRAKSRGKYSCLRCLRILDPKFHRLKVCCSSTHEGQRRRTRTRRNSVISCHSRSSHDTRFHARCAGLMRFEEEGVGIKENKCAVGAVPLEPKYSSCSGRHCDACSWFFREPTSLKGCFCAVVASRQRLAGDQAESTAARKFLQCDEIRLPLFATPLFHF